MKLSKQTIKRYFRKCGYAWGIEKLNVINIVKNVTLKKNWNVNGGR